MITIAELLREKQKMREAEKQYRKQKEVRKNYLSDAKKKYHILQYQRKTVQQYPR